MGRQVSDYGAAMTQTPDTIDYRQATNNDQTDIWDVTQEVAPEIPVSLDTPRNQEMMQTLIIHWAGSGHSWIASKPDGTAVGFVLAKPEFDNKGTVSLLYIGVRAESRERGIFKTLMEKLKAKGVPLIASVLHTNKSAMVDRLVKMGFAKVGSDATETKLQWSPPAEVKG